MKSLYATDADLLKKTDETVTEGRDRNAKTVVTDAYDVNYYGLGTWYTTHHTELETTQESWDGCQSKCLKNTNCRAFTRFHTWDAASKLTASGPRPCVLYKNEFDNSHKIVRVTPTGNVLINKDVVNSVPTIPKRSNWEGDVVNVTRY